MRFSRLTFDFPSETNRLYTHVEALRAEGIEWVDLVGGNVADNGISFPTELLGDILVEAAGRTQSYRPDPLGQRVAREAIANYSDVDPAQVLLTPGTSISYLYLFKLLCDPGDQVLCPVPSYPLFDYIAQFAGIEIQTYRLDEGQEWEIDLEHLENQVRPESRAIVVVSPHNPTGMVARGTQLEGLGRIAREHELAIISDEVFSEFVFEGATPGDMSGIEAPLVFHLNGFSKMFALPGLKIGWMAVRGDRSQVGRAMTTLELISDTFLPVNEIAQASVPKIFEQGQVFLSEYRKEIETRRNAALSALGTSVGVRPRGGFYMVLPYERDIGEETLAIELLDQEHALVHPGYFYDIEGRHLVFSHVSDADTLREVLTQIRKHL